MGIEVCQILFSASIEMIMRFLSFLLFMWYITLIDLYTLNCPYELGMKPISQGEQFSLCVVGFSMVFC